MEYDHGVDDSDTMFCMKVSHNEVNCNGTRFFTKDDSVDIDSPMFWGFLAIYVGLVIFAGIASGLTLGLLSLDTTTLSIISNGSESPSERKQAKALLPIIKRHHLLLVTLLLSNAAAVESMPIFLDRISDPFTSVLVSVTAVLFFGEVIPQAICSRFGTAIGYYSIPLVYLLMGITFVVSWPVSKLLDYCLGSHHGTYYKRSELGALVDILTDQNNEENTEPLTHDERLIIKGALLMRNKAVRDTAYTKLDDVYMIDYNAVFDYNLSKEVLRYGKSRVPLYLHEKSNIVGLILVKFLVGCNPADEIPVKNIFMSRGRTISSVSEDCPLYDLLAEFQDLGNHMAVVTGKPHHATTSNSTVILRRGSRKSISKLPSVSEDMHDSIPEVNHHHVLGIITLEDVLEELLQEEILDEADKMRLLHRNLYSSIGRSGQSQRGTKTKASAKLLKSKSQDLTDAARGPPLLIRPNLSRQRSAEPITSPMVYSAPSPTFSCPQNTPQSSAGDFYDHFPQTTKSKYFRMKGAREQVTSEGASSGHTDFQPDFESMDSLEQGIVVPSFDDDQERLMNSS